MKLAHIIAALAFATVGGLGMTTAANAQPAPPVIQGSYCLHGYNGGSDCGYQHRQQCATYAEPMGGWCTASRGTAYLPERYGYAMAERR